MQLEDDRLVERELDINLRASEEEEPWARVVVHNDDTTPYDFVIVVLLRFFPIGPQEAQHVTWTAHTSGQALVAVLPESDAQRRVGRAHFAAALEGYPLTFSVEPA